jgi:hypothetical protein
MSAGRLPREMAQLSAGRMFFTHAQLSDNHHPDNFLRGVDALPPGLMTEPNLGRVPSMHLHGSAEPICETDRSAS